MTNDPKDIIEAGADVLRETAKAEQEQQKTIQSLISLAKDAGDFLKRICGPAADEFGLMMGEQMRYWRFANFVRITGLAETLIRERGIDPNLVKTLPFGDAIRTLESASLEDDESVQEVWARLIANAADPAADVTIKKTYVDLLKSLSAPEIVFLDLVYASRNGIQIKKSKERWNCLEDDSQKVAIQNLIRLRCLAFRPNEIRTHNLFATLDSRSFSQRGHHLSFGHQWSAVDARLLMETLESIVEMIFLTSGATDRLVVHDPRNFILTPLGIELMDACRPIELDT